jgi:hypothetical protein
MLFVGRKLEYQGDLQDTSKVSKEGILTSRHFMGKFH